MSWIKIAAHIVALVGLFLVLGDIIYAPHTLLLESSPERPLWLSSWLRLGLLGCGWVLLLAVDIATGALIHQPRAR